MDINSLLTELKNLSPEKQIAKLKVLKDSVSTEQLKMLEMASQDAGQPWLASALLDIVNNKKQTAQISPKSNPTQDTFDIDAIRSEAISESIGQMLHELEPLLGSINLYAETETPEYANSKLKGELDLLEETIETFENWRKVEQPAKYKLSNILQLLKPECERLSPISSVDISLNISDELIFNTDPSMLRIIFSNALRNSVEACKPPTHRQKKPILINASMTDKHLWISIIDDGLGLQSDSEELLQSRFTTKPGNRGLGLAIINKAVTSLNGQWKLENSKPNGTEFYLELPQKEY